MSDPILPHRPDLSPSAAPLLTPQSTQTERDEYTHWWNLDNVIQHVLLARLGNNVRMILPEENSERSAREIYETLRTNFGTNRRSEGTNIFLDILSLRCNPHRIRDYVSAWQNAVTKMRSCRFIIPGYVLSLLFVKNLPDSLTFSSVRSSLGTRLENVTEADMEIFKEVIGNVIELDAQFKSVTSFSHSRNSSRLGHSQLSRTSSTPASAGTAPESRHAPPPVIDRLMGPLPPCHGGGNHNSSRHVHDARQAPARAFVNDGDGVLNSQVVSAPGGVSDDRAPDVLSVGAYEHERSDSLPISSFAALSVPYSHSSDTNDDDSFDVYDVPVPQASSFVSSAFLLDQAVSHLATRSSSCVNTLLDSGSTHHIIHDKSLFSNYDMAGATLVGTANCGVLLALGSGDVALRLPFGERFVTLRLKGCLHAPDVPINLLSVGVLQSRRIAVRFEAGTSSIPPFTELVFPLDHPVVPGYVLHASVFRNLSFLSCTFIIPTSPLAFPAVSSSAALSTPSSTPLSPPSDLVFPRLALSPALWHCRLGHLGLDSVRTLLTKDSATGLKFSGSFDPVCCVPCILGKAPQQPYTHLGNRAAGVGDLLHMDTCGPFPTATPLGKRYFHVILDDCSNFGFTALLHARPDAVPFYKNTEAFLERKTGRRVLTVHMDGARELSENELAGHFCTAGIAVQVTAPYAHSQNGKAERYVRTLEDGSQVLLADSGLPASFWGDAVLTVQYVCNRVPTSTLPLDKTPHEVFYGKKPDLSHLRVWGCQCFATIPPELRSKGGNRRFEAIFVGYEEGRVGWRVRDLQGRFHFSRDVIFNEASAGRRLRLPRTVPAPLPAEHPSRPSRDSSVPPSLTSPSPGGDLICRSSRIAARSALTAFDDYSPISLVSLEPDALAFATLPPDRRWNLSKKPLSFAEACARPDAAVWHAAMKRELASLREMDTFAECPLRSHWP